MEKKLRLVFGYQVRADEVARDVVLGHVVTGADLFRISDEDDDQGATLGNLLVLQAAITQFGQLRMPVPMNVLLSLKRVDRHLLAEAYGALVKEAVGTRKAAKLGGGRYRLARGFEADGAVFDVVEFGNHLTGYDEMAADELTRARQSCFLMGREITRLSQSDGAAVKTGPIPLELFEGLYADDLSDLQKFQADWYESFRPPEGDAVQGDTGAGGGGADDVSRAAGGNNS